MDLNCFLLLGFLCLCSVLFQLCGLEVTVIVIKFVLLSYQRLAKCFIKSFGNVLGFRYEQLQPVTDNGGDNPPKPQSRL